MAFTHMLLYQASSKSLYANALYKHLAFIAKRRNGCLQNGYHASSILICEVRWVEDAAYKSLVEIELVVAGLWFMAKLLNRKTFAVWTINDHSQETIAAHSQYSSIHTLLILNVSVHMRVTRSIVISHTYHGRQSVFYRWFCPKLPVVWSHVRIWLYNVITKEHWLTINARSIHGWVKNNKTTIKHFVITVIQCNTD